MAKDLIARLGIEVPTASRFDAVKLYWRSLVLLNKFWRRLSKIKNSQDAALDAVKEEMARSEETRYEVHSNKI